LKSIHTVGAGKFLKLWASSPFSKRKITQSIMRRAARASALADSGVGFRGKLERTIAFNEADRKL
jgi:hypothetical protein